MLTRGPPSQCDRLWFPAACGSSQPLLAPQALVESDHMQLIHHPRAHLHQTVPMPQQFAACPDSPNIASLVRTRLLVEAEVNTAVDTGIVDVVGNLLPRRVVKGHAWSRGA